MRFAVSRGPFHLQMIATQAGHEVENSGVFSILAGPSEILVITQAEPCLVQLALYRPCGG